jgi:hypothetical protein
MNMMYPYVSGLKRDGVFTPSQRFNLGVILNIMPEFKRVGQIK